MGAKTLVINGMQVSSAEGSTILQAATDAGVHIPTLCHLEGVTDVGACRLCLVEIAGSTKLLPACTTKVSEGMEIMTESDRLRRYRRTVIELLLAERNHVCAICVSNGQCELQNLASALHVDHVSFDYQFPKWEVDQSHPLFGMDHNRCVLCTRCVRTCWQVEGAGTKNVAARGAKSRIITDLNVPWGEAASCTSCGKCVQSCPTGALFYKGSSVAEMRRDRSRLEFIVTARERKQWTAYG